VSEGAVREFHLVPEELGLSRGSIDELRGGDAAQNAQLLRAVLEGEKGARRTAVLLNAGAALAASGVCATLAEAVKRAASAVDSGAARQRIDALVAVSCAEKAKADAAAPPGVPT
jgi:anthranilate phosphoribosyltransferase